MEATVVYDDEEITLEHPYRKPKVYYGAKQGWLTSVEWFAKAKAKPLLVLTYALGWLLWAVLLIYALSVVDCAKSLYDFSLIANPTMDDFINYGNMATTAANEGYQFLLLTAGLFIAWFATSVLYRIILKVRLYRYLPIIIGLLYCGAASLWLTTSVEAVWLDAASLRQNSYMMLVAFAYCAVVLAPLVVAGFLKAFTRHMFPSEQLMAENKGANRRMRLKKEGYYDKEHTKVYDFDYEKKKEREINDQYLEQNRLYKAVLCVLGVAIGIKPYAGVACVISVGACYCCSALGAAFSFGQSIGGVDYGLLYGNMENFIWICSVVFLIIWLIGGVASWVLKAEDLIDVVFSSLVPVAIFVAAMFLVLPFLDSLEGSSIGVTLAKVFGPIVLLYVVGSPLTEAL